MTINNKFVIKETSIGMFYVKDAKRLDQAALGLYVTFNDAWAFVIGELWNKRAVA